MSRAVSQRHQGGEEMRWQDDDGCWSDEKWKEDDGPHPLVLFFWWLIAPGIALWIIEKLFT
jgi:hypothetical protein